MPKPELYTWLHVARELRGAGLSYRQIDYWERCGAIQYAIPGEGSGTRRRFSRDDIDRLVTLARLLPLVQDQRDLVELIWSSYEAFESGDVVAIWRSDDEWHLSLTIPTEVDRPILLLPVGVASSATTGGR